MASVGLGLKRLLRSPRLIVGEIGAIAAAGVLMTVVPQAADRLAIRRFALEHPGWSPLVRALSLDHVLESWWFVAVLVLAGASLSIVLVEQARRVARQWREPVGPASFRSAPYRLEFDRTPADADGTARATIRTTGRVGLLGSPLFHLGLMLVLVAGVARALSYADAFAEVIEGEVLGSDASAFRDERHGPFAHAFQLPERIRLLRVEPARYASGALRAIRAQLAIGAEGRPAEIAVNAPLELANRTLYIASIHGPAALLEMEGALDVRAALLLRDTTDTEYEARWAVPGGTKVLVRATVSQDAARPERLEVRVVRDDALLFVGSLAPGDAVPLASGERLILHGIRGWALLHGSYDPSRWPMFAGVALASLGAALMFLVVKVDTAVVITPTGAQERVVVALRSHRFAPLYQDRFDRLVRAVRSDTTQPGRNRS